jgi:hypothetical protein
MGLVGAGGGSTDTLHGTGYDSGHEPRARDAAGLGRCLSHLLVSPPHHHHPHPPPPPPAAQPLGRILLGVPRTHQQYNPVLERSSLVSPAANHTAAPLHVTPHAAHIQRRVYE